MPHVPGHQVIRTGSIGAFDRRIRPRDDTLNRLQTLTSPQGAFGFSYDALSRRTQMTRPNNVTTTYS
jgi:YD repeat-containing protein